MKSAYQLAMERLNKTEPPVKLTAQKKKELAELDSVYAAKIAEREIFLKDQIGKAIEKRDIEAIEQIEKQISSERKRLQTELEEKKELVRQGKA